MYCSKCGEEIPASSTFCNNCGAEVGGELAADIEREQRIDYEVAGEDYDFVMAIQDGFNRTRFARTIIDLGLILVSAGFWFGLLAAEYISHHHKLKTGEREPYSGGDKKVWHVF